MVSVFRASISSSISPRPPLSLLRVIIRKALAYGPSLITSAVAIGSSIWYKENKEYPPFFWSTPFPIPPTKIGTVLFLDLCYSMSSLSPHFSGRWICDGTFGS